MNKKTAPLIDCPSNEEEGLDPTMDPMFSLLFFRQLEKGEIWINEPIFSSTVSRLNMNLNYLSERRDIKTIKLYINSGGGSLFDSLACVDFIQSINKPVYTIASGMVLSGALLLFASGDRRIAYPMSTFMAHDQQMKYWEGSRTVLKEELGFHDTINDKIVGFLASRTKLKEQEWEDLLSSPRDYYFDVQKAHEMGLVDEIVKQKNLNKKGKRK